MGRTRGATLICECRALDATQDACCSGASRESGSADNLGRVASRRDGDVHSGAFAALERSLAHPPLADIRAFAPAAVVDIISEVAAVTDLI